MNAGATIATNAVACGGKIKKKNGGGWLLSLDDGRPSAALMIAGFRVALPQGNVGHSRSNRYMDVRATSDICTRFRGAQMTQ